MTIGAACAAVVGSRIHSRLRDESIRRSLIGLLDGLIATEGFLPAFPAPFPQGGVGSVSAAASFELGIGLVASLLGVAGSELIIPTLVFGLDVEAAGTASPLISLPTVVIGLWGYGRLGAFRDREALRTVVLPMALGSIGGVFLGGWMVGDAPALSLEVFLGTLLIVSVGRAFGREHESR